jgi:hypothetical protein
MACDGYPDSPLARWLLSTENVTWQLPTVAVTSLHLRGSFYQVVAWQCVDQIHYNINQHDQILGY